MKAELGRFLRYLYVGILLVSRMSDDLGAKLATEWRLHGVRRRVVAAGLEGNGKTRAYPLSGIYKVEQTLVIKIK